MEGGRLKGGRLIEVLLYVHYVYLWALGHASMLRLHLHLYFSVTQGK